MCTYLHRECISGYAAAGKQVFMKIMHLHSGALVLAHGIDLTPAGITYLTKGEGA